MRDSGPRRLVLPLLLAAALLGVVLPIGAVHAAPKPPSPSVTFGLGPANAKKVDGRPYFNYVASPRSTFTDHVALVNVSGQPLSLDVYVTDASNALDGSFTYPLKSSAAREAGTWMSVGTPHRARTVVVAARSTVVYPLTVKIPANAAPGDHAAAVIVSLTALSRGGKGQNVNLEQRVAARAFVRVSGPLHPGLTLERLHGSFSAAGLLSGSASVTYRVKNSGNVKLSGQQVVTAGGLFQHATVHGQEVPVLLPGGALDVTTRVKGIAPQIWMSAKVTVTPLGIQGDVVPALGDTVASTHFLAIPWLLLGLLLLLGLGYTWRRRRRARRPSPASSAARPAALVSAVVALLAFPGAPAHATDALPYSDSAVTGSIGLCDVHGNNVLTGKITDKPFVWLAVGTTRASAPYAAAGRSAFLAAYQPRQGIDPGDWSGYGLAAASRYSNPDHPMSQATPLSSSLQNFLGRYPAQWDGLVQLRLLLAGSNRSPRLAAYDATDIQVTGDTWRVVRGGTGPCRAGQAVNTAVLLHAVGAAGTPKPGAVASPPAPNGTPAPQVTRTAAAAAGPDAVEAASSRPAAGIQGGSLTGLLAVGGAGVAVGGGLVLWTRRRRSA